MKPLSIKARREKEVRKLQHERQELYKKSVELGYRELEKPIRHGWYLELTLTPQLERYRFKPEIEEIVKKLHRRYWGRTKEEALKKWEKAESEYLIYRNIPTLSPKSYRKLSNKAKHFCTVFVYYQDRKIRRRFYVRIPKHAHKIKYTRAYTTHSKIIDPKIEERLDLIEQQLLKPGWYALGQCSYRCRWDIEETVKDRKRIKRKLKKHLYTSIEEVKNELKWENKN